MASVTPLKAPKSDADERQLRVDLAAVFRMAAALGWHEATANHFSVAVSADGKRFLMMKETGPTEPDATSASMIVVLNWFEELKSAVK